ncbi:unnamed protein product [Calypogeia fissa]
MNSGDVQRRRRIGPGPAIAADSADHFQNSQHQHGKNHRSSYKKVLKSSGAERRTTSAQSRCYTTSCNLDPKHKRIHNDHHSDFPKTTVEKVTYSISDGSECSDDSLTTTSDSPTSVQELYVISPYYLDSADKLINLPDDLIREVLRRLSVKEIVRISCLNRAWRTEMERLINYS